MLEDLEILSENTPLDLKFLLLNLVVGFFLSLILRVHFQRYGSTLSNRQEFSQVFPFILLTTILIITVVKSSLALSLGLVGALSIVRFRTPIKEPEELAYLFLAIATGLGLGANQTLPTIFSTLFILLLMAGLSSSKSQFTGKNIYLSLDLPYKDNAETYLEKINGIITLHTIKNDLRRFDIRDNRIEATYFIDLSESNKLSA